MRLVWFRFAGLSRRLMLITPLIVGVIMGCLPEPTPVVVPTQTLIPSTATPTATPVIPTPTPDAVMRASDLQTVTDEPDTFEPLLQTTITPDAVSVETYRLELAEWLGVSVASVRFVGVEPTIWTDSSLGCDSSRLRLERARQGLRYQYLLANRVYAIHTGDQDDYAICTEPERLHGDLLLAVDLIADEMVQLARRRVAQQLDLPIRRIALVDVIAYTWPDTSLGCPVPDVDYNDAEISGYRIVLEAGDQTYEYHTDSVSLFLCPPERVVLPE